MSQAGTDMNRDSCPGQCSLHSSALHVCTLRTPAVNAIRSGLAALSLVRPAPVPAFGPQHVKPTSCPPRATQAWLQFCSQPSEGLA